MKTALALTVALAMGLMWMSDASAGTLDQSCLVPSPVGQTSIRSDSAGHLQTFTVGRTGTLDHIGLQMRWNSFPNADLEIYIHQTTADPYHVTGLLMASLTVPYTSFPQFTASDQIVTVIDLGAQAFDVISGEQYCIRLATAANGSGDYNWAYTPNDVYAGGQRHSYAPATGFTMPYAGDCGFEAYVVPEPATLSLLAAGVLLYRRRRA
jgi:hypothetical protein